MKLRNTFLILPFIAFKTISCSYNEYATDPIQVYLESNIVGKLSVEQKQAFCTSAFNYVWKNINCSTKKKQTALYNICQHADKYKHNIPPETAHLFFEALRPVLIYRLNSAAIQREETKRNDNSLDTESVQTGDHQPNPFYFSRSEKRTKNIAFCCRFFHQRLKESDDFNFDNSNCYKNKDNFNILLDQVHATAVKADTEL